MADSGAGHGQRRELWLRTCFGCVIERKDGYIALAVPPGGDGVEGDTVLARFPASASRGSWPAEQFAAEQRGEGVAATVVMSLDADVFLSTVRRRDVAGRRGRPRP